MYAVIEVGGKQYKVEQGEELLVDRLDVDEGKSMTLVPLLLGGDRQAVTAVAAKGAKVKAKVEEHLLGKKVRVFKYKPKKGYRRNNGHRSRLSKISIQTITAGGKKAAAKAATPEKTEKVEKAAAKTDKIAGKTDKASVKTEATAGKKKVEKDGS